MVLLEFIVCNPLPKSVQVNAIRLFLSPRKDLREMVGESYGKSLSGITVSSRLRYDAAVAQLRTPEGHDPAARWANPINWIMYER